MRIHPAPLIVCVSIGCGADGVDTSAEEGCGYETREVDLDARFGDETPRAVIELLERPVSSQVTWFAGENEDLVVTGASGQSEVEVRAVAGSTVWVREGIEGKGGVVERRLACPTYLDFEVALRIESADGALKEDWSGTAVYGVSGVLGGIGSIMVRVQDPPAFSGDLTITEQPGVAQRWDTRELLILMNFATSPLDFVGMHGQIFYNFENLVSEGEIVGASRTIAEFSWQME